MAPLTYAEALSKAQTQSLAKKRAALELEQAALERQLVEYDDDAHVTAAASWGSAYRETATTRAGEKPDYVAHAQSYGVRAQMPLYDFGVMKVPEEKAL